jgi:hypothetical protein
MNGMLTIADNLEIPLEGVTETFGILAKRGMGKTYCGAVLAEEMLKASQQVIVADPVGVWWGLRNSADGAAPGLPIVVFGGAHGDLPLSAVMGPALAELAVSERLSMVLDLSALSKAEAVRLMTGFCETLYHRNREPLHLILDEADAFAPQRPLPGHQRLLGAMDDLVRRGRARGIGVTMITQRPAVLNKDVLTQIEVLIALRMTAPQDQAAIDTWVRSHGTPEQREELMRSLPSLPIGDAWLWSPGWLDRFVRIHVRQRETFDSSATPKVGERIVAPTASTAVVDLERIRIALEGAISEAQSEDSQVLRGQIADLQQQLRDRPVERVVERVEVPVFREGEIDRLSDAAGNQATRWGVRLDRHAQNAPHWTNYTDDTRDDSTYSIDDNLRRMNEIIERRLHSALGVPAEALGIQPREEAVDAVDLVYRILSRPRRDRELFSIPIDGGFLNRREFHINCLVPGKVLEQGIQVAASDGPYLSPPAEQMERDMVNWYHVSEPSYPVFCECGRTFIVTAEITMRVTEGLFCLGCGKSHPLWPEWETIREGDVG